MKKIEKEMINAICEKKEMAKSNTNVIINRNGIFVRLYESLIYAKVNGKDYYSNGGWDTVTTRSRLYACGFCKGGKLHNQKEMINLLRFGKTEEKQLTFIG